MVDRTSGPSAKGPADRLAAGVAPLPGSGRPARGSRVDTAIGGESDRPQRVGGAGGARPASGVGSVQAPGRVGRARPVGGTEAIDPQATGRLAGAGSSAAARRPLLVEDEGRAHRFVEVDGMRYDLDAPRGTYLNILV